jgi:hypothetical protein
MVGPFSKGRREGEGRTVEGSKTRCGFGTRKAGRVPFDPDSQCHIDAGGNDLPILGIAKSNFSSDGQAASAQQYVFGTFTRAWGHHFRG